MRALVTGCAGFVGSHLVDRLLVDGWDVIGYDNLSSGKRENLPTDPTFKFYQGDIGDWDMLDMAFGAGVDAVFHQAAATMPYCDNPARAFMVNANGSLRVALLSIKHKVPKFVYASTCSVYGDCAFADEQTPPKPNGVYASSKLAGEYAIQSVRDCCVLRYASLYGPRHWGGVIQKWQRQMSDGEPVTIYGDGEQTRTMTHVADVIEANIRALELDGVHNVAGPRAYTMNEVSDLMGVKERDYIPDTTEAPRHSVIESDLGHGRPFCV